MTTPKTVLLNTLEQVLSTDINRVGALAGKAAMDALIFAEASFVNATPRSVVLDGLDATIGAGLTVDVADGSLARFAAAAGADASKYELGTLQALENVVFGAADATNPRIDLIHGTPASNDTDSSSRNVLVLPGRTVVSTSVSKTREPDLTLAVEPGTAGATPNFPAAPAGSVALWYVLIPANVVTIDADHLMDARVQFNPAALSRAHHRVDGLYAGHSVASLTDILIRSGRALVDGAVLDHLADQTFSPATSILAPGSGSLIADTEYSIYAVAKGSGNPVGRTVTDGFVPVLEPSNPPNADGRPSLSFSYRPLIGFGVDFVTFPTTDALYLGTLHTDGSPQFQNGGDGIPLNRDGTASDQTLDLAGGGFAGKGFGWIRPPSLRFVGIDTVSITTVVPVIDGIPGVFPATTATLSGDLIAADAPEAASTFYFVYLRPRISTSTITRGTIRNYKLIISSEPPDAFGFKPTPEATFSSIEYRFVGSFFNNSGSDIEQFERVGDRVIYLSRDEFLFINLAQSTARSLISPTQVPSSSRIAIQELGFTGTSTLDVIVRIFHKTGVTVEGYRELMRAEEMQSTVLDVVLDGSGDYEANKDVSSSVFVRFATVGYLEDVEST